MCRRSTIRSRTTCARPAGGGRIVVHRIDQDTSGLVAFAKDALAGAAQGAVQAPRAGARVLGGRLRPPDPPSGTWRDRLVWDTTALIQKATHPKDPQGTDAISRLRDAGIVRATPSSIEVRLETGRRNQIRIQARLRGHTLVGENATPTGPRRSARLPSAATRCTRVRLAFRHPIDDRPLTFEAPRHPYFADLLARTAKVRRECERFYGFDRFGGSTGARSIGSAVRPVQSALVASDSDRRTTEPVAPVNQHQSNLRTVEPVEPTDHLSRERTPHRRAAARRGRWRSSRVRAWFTGRPASRRRAPPSAGDSRCAAAPHRAPASPAMFATAMVSGGVVEIRQNVGGDDEVEAGVLDPIGGHVERRPVARWRRHPAGPGSTCGGGLHRRPAAAARVRRSPIERPTASTYRR